MRIRTYSSHDRAAIIALWNDCALTRPWNDPGLDIDRKLAIDDDLFLVGVLDTNPESIMATVMVGYDGHRGWVNYLAVAPDQQGRGYGRELMQAAETRLLERGCPKLNLQVRTGNEAVLAFYASLGYSVDDAVSLGKRLIADD